MRPADKHDTARFRKSRAPFLPGEIKADAWGTRDAASVVVPERRAISPGGPAVLKAQTAGWLLGWPWLDPLARWLLRHWYFPLSRLWAAAGVADGSVERFFEAVPLDPLTSPRYGLAERLAHFEAARASAAAVDAAWRRAFFPADGFAGDRPSETELVALEKARLDSEHRHYATRTDFRSLLRTDAPRVRFEPLSPAEVAAAYGPALADPAPFFAAPDPMPEVTVSRSIRTPHGRNFWLSFTSPSKRLGDRVFARVHEPDGIADPPTIIFGHGVCVEFDHWRGLIDEAGALPSRGVRVIRPEAPWHGRRTPRGYYGGEKTIATFPMGSLDLMTAAVREWAVLADWARRTSSGPLAFGGSSLGAMTAQLAADRARHWPGRLRPGALFLVTHCRRLLDTVTGGELMIIFGGREAVEARGWTVEMLAPYLDLLSPSGTPAVPPERIVSVLGRRDRITPFASGRDLVQSWGVPERNLFIWDRGHFSVPVTLMRNPAPVERFCAVFR